MVSWMTIWKLNRLEYKIFSINYLCKRLYIMRSSILEKQGSPNIDL